MELSSEIGARIKEARIKAGMSQKILSRYLRISERTLLSYEKGSRDIPAKLLIKIAYKCGEDVNYLLTGLQSDPDKITRMEQELQTVLAGKKALSDQFMKLWEKTHQEVNIEMFNDLKLKVELYESQIVKLKNELAEHWNEIEAVKKKFGLDQHHDNTAETGDFNLSGIPDEIIRETISRQNILLSGSGSGLKIILKTSSENILIATKSEFAELARLYDFSPDALELINYVLDGKEGK